MLRTEIAGFRGDTFTPGDAGYDEARRVFNGMIDRYPALIARCTNHNDVVAAVTHAREEGVPLAVYGGGHAVTGHAVCDDGDRRRPARDEGDHGQPRDADRARPARR